MARLHSTLKGGYYPFPPAHLPAVASLFAPAPRGGLALDACAGEGGALEYLSRALRLTAYANELDHDRAEACRARFGVERVAEGDLLMLRTSHEAFALNWLNPPYASNHAPGSDETRRELEFLKHAWAWTQIGGYTCWVVYAHHLSAAALRFLLSRSSQLDLYRIPGLHLDSYPQVVAVARKAAAASEPDEAALEALVETCRQPDRLPLLSVIPEPVYRLPDPAGVRRFHFHADEITAGVMRPLLDKYGCHLLNIFQAAVDTAPPAPPLEPIVPPRGGQLGLTLAAGLFDGLVLNLDDSPAAVRGVARTVEINTTPPELVGIRETFELRPQVTISLLRRDGQVRTLDGGDQAALVEFLKTHRQAFLEYLDAHSTPLYDFDYRHLNPIFARVFRSRKLPGRPTTGLFETQRHVTAAAYAALQRRRTLIVQGEMGVGKSAIGAALAGSLHARRHLRPGQVVVVMYPPHLARKWPRELQDAIPNCVVETVKTVDDVAAFMQRAARDPGRLYVLCMSREAGKLGEGWEPAYITRQRRQAQWPHGQPPPRRFEGRERIVTDDLLCCPACGQEIPTRQDLTGTASLNWLKQQPRACYRCGSALWQLKRHWSAPAPGQRLPKRNPRYPLARFLRQRYAGRIGLALIDELHELKAESSDQGRALHDLARVSDRLVGLTGTLFGGTASSVFWLEWAFNPRLHRQYPLDEGRAPAVSRWVRTMGVLERVVEYQEDNAGSGAYSGLKRVEHAPQEVPGVSPRLIPELLDHTLFVSLADLGFALPDYQDIPVPVKLPDDVQHHYDAQKKTLLDYLMSCRNEGDASFLSTYLQATLRYPTACFRPKPVVHRLPARDTATGGRREHHVTTLQGFGEDRLYPKEEKLLELLKSELAEGRRCAVFAAQTGELDIQPRLLKLIQTHVPDARPFVLQAGSPATDAREAHIDKRLGEGHNLLICNPRLVMTGLDLVAFPTLIFVELDYSLYVTSQAARRAWRIGQQRPCKTYYLYYSSTMEEQAIELVSRKQAAAALLGGDADGGGLAQLSGGSNSLLAELAKTIAQDSAVVDATQLFKRQAEASLDFTSGWAAAFAAGTAGQAAAPELPATPEPPSPSAPTASPTPITLIRRGEYLYAFGPDAQRVSQATGALVERRADPGGQVADCAAIPVESQGYWLLKLERAGLAVTLTQWKEKSMPTTEQLSALLRQRAALKAQFPNALLLLAVGEFLEAFDEDAEVLARELDIVLTSRMVGERRIPMAGLPQSDADAYITKLISKGYHVAVAQPGSAAPDAAPTGGLAPQAVKKVIAPHTPVQPTAAAAQTRAAAKPAPQSKSATSARAKPAAQPGQAPARQAAKAKPKPDTPANTAAATDQPQPQAATSARVKPPAKPAVTKTTAQPKPAAAVTARGQPPSTPAATPAPPAPAALPAKSVAAVKAAAQARAAARGKPAQTAALKPTTPHPHAELLGRRFRDAEDREVVVVGPDLLFPQSHVQIEREGKRYGVLVTRLLDAYTPLPTPLQTPAAHTSVPASAAAAPEPLTPDQQHYADLVDAQAEAEPKAAPAAATPEPERWEGVLVTSRSRDELGRLIRHLEDGSTVTEMGNGITSRTRMLDMEAITASRPKSRGGKDKPASPSRRPKFTGRVSSQPAPTAG